MPDPRKLYVCRFEVEMVVYAEGKQQAIEIVRVNCDEQAVNVADDLVESDAIEINNSPDIPYAWLDALPYTITNVYSGKPGEEDLVCQEIIEQKRSNAADGP